jgi:hypothetical protein
MAEPPRGTKQSTTTDQVIDGTKDPWGRFTVTGLEADIAYFQARLELIGEPETINQKGQVAVFRILLHGVGRILTQLKGKSPARL